MKLHYFYIPIFASQLFACGSSTNSPDKAIVENQAPTLELMDSVTIDEGQAVQLKPIANDPDGDTVTLSYSGWMNNDSYATTYADAGTYTVTVTASDGLLSVSSDVLVTVNNVNRAPTLATVPDIEVSEGEKITFSPVYSDLDGDDVSVTYSGWMTNEHYVTGLNDQGEHLVTIHISDGALSSSQDVRVTVNNTPVQMGLSFPPVGSVTERDFTLRETNHLAVNNIRFAEEWRLREPIQGQYNWAALDEKLSWAKANNLAVMLTIQSNGPDWACEVAQKNSNSCVFTTDGKQAFTTYVNALLQRYPNQISKLQFGNEWVSEFWFVGSGQQFSEYHNIVNTAVKLHSPDTQMVLGGFATVVLQNLSYCQGRIDTFYEDSGVSYGASQRDSFCASSIVQAGMQKIIDVLSLAQYDYLDIHLYDFAEEWASYLAAIQSMDTEPRPVIVSEFGGPHPVLESDTDEYQATRLITYLETIASLPVEQAYYYRLVDDDTSFHNASGLIRATSAALTELKPAYYVFKERDNLPLSGPPVSSATKRYFTSFESLDDFSGFYLTEQDHMSTTSHELVDDIVKSGTTSHKAWMYGANTPSTETENNNHRGYPTIQLQTTALDVFNTPVLVEFWVWLDATLAAGEWFSFATLDHTESEIWDPVLVNLSDEGYVHLMHVPTNGEGDWDFQTNSVAFPMREWVKLSICLHFDQSQGYAKVWQNDVLVSSAQVHKGNGQFTQAHFGLYTPPAMESGTVYNDDLLIIEGDCL